MQLACPQGATSRQLPMIFPAYVAQLNSSMSPGLKAFSKNPSVRAVFRYLCMGSVAAAGAGATGVMAKVSHVFHPSGRFCAANSLYAFTFK